MATDNPKEGVMKAHCPRCDGERQCDIHGAFDQPWEWSDEEHSENGQTDHRILQCRGCETVFYWQSSWDTQSVDWRYNRRTGEEEQYLEITKATYPKPDKKSIRPDWAWDLHKADSALGTIMDEVYTAAESRTYILAAVGLRTALDRVSDMVGVEPTLPMGEKVNSLVEHGWIAKSEAVTLGTVAEAGHAAAHRGWEPTSDEFNALLSAMETFFNRAIIVGKRVEALAPKIPPKPPRPPKLPKDAAA